MDSVAQVLRNGGKTRGIGYRDGTGEGRHAGDPSRVRAEHPEISRAGKLRGVLGGPFCGGSGRRDHRAVRNEQCGTDEG